MDGSEALNTNNAGFSCTEFSLQSPERGLAFYLAKVLGTFPNENSNKTKSWRQNKSPVQSVRRTPVACYFTSCFSSKITYFCNYLCIVPPPPARARVTQRIMSCVSKRADLWRPPPPIHQIGRKMTEVSMQHDSLPAESRADGRTSARRARRNIDSRLSSQRWRKRRQEHRQYIDSAVGIRDESSLSKTMYSYVNKVVVLRSSDTSSIIIIYCTSIVEVEICLVNYNQTTYSVLADSANGDEQYNKS